MKSTLLVAATVLSMAAGLANAAPGSQYTERDGHAKPPRVAQDTEQLSANMPSAGRVMPDERAKVQTPAFNPFLNAGLNGGGG